jgi:hypothetical protein
MSVLHPDSLIMQLDHLTGNHEDIVRCVFDERLNRLKSLSDTPSEQLSVFKGVADDAMAYWEAVSVLPEDREGRRQKVAHKLSSFFDRVARYANFHDDETLNEYEKRLKTEVLQSAGNKQLSLLIYPERCIGM